LSLNPTPAPRPTAPRAALRALVTAALACAVGLTIAGTAAAASACGKKVIDDWYDNGRVDGTYQLHCYDDAIDALPRDVRDYSSAKEDIERALQNRMIGKPAPPAAEDPSPAEGEGEGEGENEGLLPGGTPEDLDGDGVPNTDDPEPSRPGDPEGVPEAVGSDVDTSSSSSSVPVPLLVLAGLALLLVAAGSLGYLARRLQARRLPPSA
jgi:hypothetical protein